MTHQCAEDANPRHKGHCGKCGRPMPPPAPGNKPGTAPRDTNVERALTRTAGQQTGLATIADQLSTYAEQRAGTGPVRNPHDRDFIQEALEEIADLRNYLVWQGQKEVLAGLDPERMQRVIDALEYTILAHHEVSQLHA